MTLLVDPFGRRVEYLGLPVIDRCDVRRFYCIPKRFSNFTETGARRAWRG